MIIGLQQLKRRRKKMESGRIFCIFKEEGGGREKRQRQNIKKYIDV